MAGVITILNLYQKAFGGIPGVFPTETRVPIGSTKEKFETYQYGDAIFLPLKIDGYKLPNEPLISIRGSKRIIKTAVADLKGTVKEHIALGDYEITIRGVAVNEDANELPQQEIMKIRQICEQLKALPVNNTLLDYFNIKKIVIEDFDFPGIPGEQNAQSYSIRAVSDIDVDLELKEEYEGL